MRLTTKSLTARRLRTIHSPLARISQGPCKRVPALRRSAYMVVCVCTDEGFIGRLLLVSSQTGSGGQPSMLPSAARVSLYSTPQQIHLHSIPYNSLNDQCY